MTSDKASDCGTYWGSHGCDLAAGHEGNHLCGSTDPDGLCSENDGSRVRYMQFDTADSDEVGEWGEWSPSETYQ